MFRGFDELKVRTIRGGGTYLENVQKRTRGRGSKISEIERTYFLNGAMLELCAFLFYKKLVLY